MSAAIPTYRATTREVRAVEALMLDKFKTEPFHNLYLLSGKDPKTLEYGGTCSDKTLSFLESLTRAGVSASLHSGYIGGEEIHRLVKVSISGRHFFADVGNGWPALRLYPQDCEIEYRCFGMGFRTEISGQRLTVFHRRNGKESLQLEIDFDGKPEEEIRADIDARFDRGIEYPFRNSVRFSLVVDERFLFLRGERLEIYSDEKFEVVSGIKFGQLPDVIHQYFDFDISRLGL